MRSIWVFRTSNFENYRFLRVQKSKNWNFLELTFTFFRFIQNLDISILFSGRTWNCSLPTWKQTIVSVDSSAIAGLVIQWRTPLRKNCRMICLNWMWHIPNALPPLRLTRSHPSVYISPTRKNLLPISMQHHNLTTLYSSFEGSYSNPNPNPNPKGA